jgi:kumamolisin
MLRHPIRGGIAAAAALATAAFTGALIAPAAASAAPTGGPRLATIRGSLSPTTDKITGGYTSPRMTVEVALAPRDQTALASQLDALYRAGSAEYHHWLAKGQFDARYAPTSAERTAVASYLTSSGLTVQRSGSPFLVRATGSSARVSSAFHTRLSSYVDPRGVRYFSNSTAVRLPTSFASGVFGVVGLTNTVREFPTVQRFNNTERPLGKSAASSSGASSSCETGYVTKQELFNAVNDDESFPYGYGGGPGCSGLTPSQTNSIYDAPNVGARGQGQGVNMAVFELSAYQKSDIDTWAHTFYGSRYTPSLVNINVDGGPLNPVCPAGDTCEPSSEAYAGDIEVDADIEMSLDISPANSHVLVYNAPNDETGQTELDEYTAIANQDRADTVSSSWAVCENDVTADYVQAENVEFEQMAMQGQSMFSSAGDTGAFECIRSDGTTIVNVLDPASQPWVTSVGGTSLETDNPGTNPNPSYPKGVETVWNVDNLCNESPATPAEGDQTGYFWCAETGAGGGGSSQYWGQPAYQHGPGIINSYTEYGNGTTQCSLAKKGTPCREEPDVSANADEYTGYAEYCTGSASTPGSDCATFSGSETPPGWFGIGGTSLSSPLWAAIFADMDGYQGHRVGNADELLYQLYDSDPGRYFHDITGIHQSTNNNGLYPTTPGYDLATGIGTPIMAALITKG